MSSIPIFVSFSDAAIKAMIGHEKAQTEQEVSLLPSFLHTSKDDMKSFQMASTVLGSGLDKSTLDIKSAEKTLGNIKIGNQQIGAHRQDLLASLVGYKFGVLVEIGLFKSREQSAEWIRLNVGGNNRSFVGQ